MKPGLSPPSIDNVVRLQMASSISTRFSFLSLYSLAVFLKGVITIKKAYKILLPALLLTVLVGTIAAVVFFTQQFPQVSVVSTLSANCSNLNDASGSVVNGTAKALTFNCSGPTTTVNAFTVTTQGSYIATFTLPSQFTSISITNSTTGTPVYALTSAAHIELAAGSYNYIVQYGGALTSSPITGFSMTWGQ